MCKCDILCVMRGTRDEAKGTLRMELFRAYAPGRLTELIDLRVGKSSSNSNAASFQLCGLSSLSPFPSLSFLICRMAAFL